MNDEQLIVGTWARKDGNDVITYVFNANGTYSYMNSKFSDKKYNGRYFIRNEKLFLDTNGAYEYYFSSNGKVLFLIQVNSSYSFWYDKQ